MLGFKYENSNKNRAEEMTPTSHAHMLTDSEAKNIQRVYAGYIGCSGLPMGEDQTYSK